MRDIYWAGRLTCLERFVSSINKYNAVQSKYSLNSVYTLWDRSSYWARTFIGLLCGLYASPVPEHITLVGFRSSGPPTVYHHCDLTSATDHMLLECRVLLENRDRYYTAELLDTLWDDYRGSFCGVSGKSRIFLSDVNGQLYNATGFGNEFSNAAMREPCSCRTANVCWRTYAVVKQM